MFTIVNKDITTVTRGVIAHGVNCQRAMGSGVAGAIAKKWPIVREEFIGFHSGLEALGLTQIVEITPDELYVANCFSQQQYGKDGQRYAEPIAVATSVAEAYKYAGNRGLPIHIPQIGCGLGGLNWDNEVMPIIWLLSEQYNNIDTKVYQWE